MDGKQRGINGDNGAKGVHLSDNHARDNNNNKDQQKSQARNTAGVLTRDIRGGMEETEPNLGEKGPASSELRERLCNHTRLQRTNGERPFADQYYGGRARNNHPVGHRGLST